MKLKIFELKFIWALPLFLSIILTSVCPSYALATPTFLKVCKARLAAIGSPLVNSNFELSPKAIEDLRAAQNLYLVRQREKRTLEDDETPIPSDLSFNGDSLKVLGILGVGGQGRVFLVKKGDRFYAAKVFHDRYYLDYNNALNKVLQTRGVEITTPVDVDIKNVTALFPYIPGLNVGDVVDPLPFFPLPVSDETRNEIITAYRKFSVNLGKILQELGTHLSPHNVVIDLENRKFIIIDPI